VINLSHGNISYKDFIGVSSINKTDRHDIAEILLKVKPTYIYIYLFGKLSLYIGATTSEALASLFSQISKLKQFQLISKLRVSKLKKLS
jgi:hypothetical protein